MKHTKFLPVLTLSLFTLLAAFTASAQENADPFAPPHEGGPKAVLIQFHRGGGSIRPDNALETFLWAWSKGAIPEADCRLTKDGVAIAFHDDNLRRLGRGMSDELKEKSIRDLNWNEIKDVDVGSYLGPEYASYRITTIEAVFAAMKYRPERLLYVDEKGASPELLAELSAKYGVQDQIIFATSNYSLIPRWKQMAPKAKALNWLHWFGINDPAEAEAAIQRQLDNLEKNGFKDVDIVQIHIRTDLSKEDPFTPSTEFLRKAGDQIKSHGKIFQVLTWTEGNNPEVYRKLIELGVQSFATDWPDGCLEGCDLK